MDKGEWVVKSRVIDGRRMFRACRKLDRTKPGDDDNLEFHGEYSPDWSAVNALVHILRLEALRDEG